MAYRQSIPFPPWPENCARQATPPTHRQVAPAPGAEAAGRRSRLRQAGASRRFSRSVGRCQCARAHHPSISKEPSTTRTARRLPLKIEYRVDFLTDRAETLPSPKARQALLSVHLPTRAAPAKRSATHAAPRAPPQRFTNSSSRRSSRSSRHLAQPAARLLRLHREHRRLRWSRPPRSWKRSTLPTTPSSSSSAITAATS